MFSYKQMARWMTAPVDPITIEDFLANREIFGAEGKPDERGRMLETAFAVEKMAAEAGTDGAIIKEGNLLLILAKSKEKKAGEAVRAEMKGGSDKGKKIIVNSGGYAVIHVDKDAEIKMTINCQSSFLVNGVKEQTWDGKGVEIIILEAKSGE